MPPSVDQILRKAKRHAQNGETALAAQHYRSILEKYPQNRKAQAGLNALQQPNDTHIDSLLQLLRQGQHQQVVVQGEALLGEFQQSAVIPKVLAEAHLALGSADKASAYFKRALELEPEDAQTNNNLGIVLQQMGRHTEAVTYFAKAVEIKPSYIDALANLGNGLKDIGQIESAIECYQKVIKKRPDDPSVHNNLGAAFNELGQSEQAIDSLLKSLQLRSKDGLTHNNLAVAFHRLGETDKAIEHFQASLELSPRNGEFWQAYAELLGSYSASVYDAQLADNFLAILNQKTIARPAHLANSIWQLLGFHPALQKSLALLEQEINSNTLIEICSDLTKIPLLLRITALCPVYDLKLEKLFRTLRRLFLLNIDEIADRSEILEFLSAIALQCFTNEYLYGETDEESTRIVALEKNIEDTIAASNQPAAAMVACLASYRPLHIYSWAGQVDFPEVLSELQQRQLAEVEKEASIRGTIQSFGDISNQVSNQVRAQYEENPYPRWINTALAQRPLDCSTLARNLQLKLVDDQALARQPNVLIAGCGTGQQALVAATRFSQSQVLAIDLSLSSLSYAFRKTREFGLSNINYLQADILDLEALDSQFDLIESVGVLHHMDEPLAGWKILCSKLKPNGLMKIGLYSEVARKGVVEAREKIAASGLSSSTADMLSFRSNLIEDSNENAELASNLSNFSDFYSTSELRDLLFHVSEHRFTLPQIKQCLDELNLTFAGFEFWSSAVKQHFSQSHPDPDSHYDLNKWHEFELANPDAFRGMYQFWVQKHSSA
ncbi:MAG: tetratricopeptide repeat protein [Pseudomonadales bacterium]|nr:tetratricopeptide repeat protein [Pseudomonadales bacterium]